MNEPNLLDRELSELGERIRREPSIMESVMQQIAGEPKSINADQESMRPTRRRLNFIMPFSATMAAIAATVMLLFFFRTDSIGFAQVQQQLAKIQTMTGQIRRTLFFKNVENQSKPRVLTAKLWYRSDGKERIEWHNGTTIVSSRDDFRKLTVNPVNKTVTLAYSYDLVNSRSVIETLRSLHDPEKAERIPDKLVDGLACPGFRIQDPDSTLNVWISPNTLLPIFTERVYVSIEDEDGPERIVESYEAIQFDVPIADEFFSVRPPDGYAVIETGMPPSKIDEVFTESPAIATHVGLGPIEFGMNAAEIIQLLGTPDKTDTHRPHFSDQDISNIDGVERPPGTSLVVLTEFQSLSYDGLGLSLTLESKDGLKGILCRRKSQLSNGVEIPGETIEGIGLGSSVKDVLAAYGKPDQGWQGDPSQHAITMPWIWKKQGYTVTFSPEQQVQMFGFDDGIPNQLRFEWRPDQLE